MGGESLGSRGEVSQKNVCVEATETVVQVRIEESCSKSRDLCPSASDGIGSSEQARKYRSHQLSWYAPHLVVFPTFSQFVSRQLVNTLQLAD